MSDTPPGKLRFGPYRFDLRDERLWRDGQPVPVTRKSFAVLGALLARPGHLLTKEELFGQVWTGRVVSDAALTRCIRELRLALKDDAGSPRYIETVHGRGFRFIARVAGEQTGTIASLAPNIHFVGRDTELQRLRHALDKTMQQERQIVFVTGEAGIGKTATVEAFLAQCLSGRQIWLGQGRCIEQYGAGEAYMPVLEALDSLRRFAGNDRLAELLEQHAPAWLTQLPSLTAPADRERLEHQVAGATRQRMLREISHVLEAIAAERPLVLWLEDLQWSDHSTLDVLSYLAARRDPMRLMLIGSYRPADALATEHALRLAHQEWQLRGQCEAIALDYLSVGAMQEYLGKRLGSEGIAELPLRALASALHGRSEGNPLFMVAMLDDLVRRGAFSETEGRWRLASSIDQLNEMVPEDLKHVIEARAGRLVPEQQRLLEVASAVGFEFSSGAVAAALHANLQQTEEQIETLARQGQFVQARGHSERTDGRAASRYTFLHALYQETLYSRLSAARRSELHRCIGGWQEQAYGQRAGIFASELAMHFERGKDYPKAVRYLEQAGKNALARGAHAEAKQLYARGLELLRHLADPDERNRLELALQVGLCVPLLMTKGYAASEVEQVYARARQLSTRVGQGPSLFPVLRGIWAFHLVRAELATARQLAEHLLTLARDGHDSALLLEAHLALGSTLLWLGEIGDAQEHARQALALYDPHRHRAHLLLYGHDPAVICLSYAARGLWALGYPDQAQKKIDEALALAHDHAHPHSVASALNFSAWVQQYRGDAQQTHERAKLTMGVSTEQGFALFLAAGQVLAGWAQARLGKVQEGIAQMCQGVDALLATGAQLAQPYFLALLAEAYGEAGQHDKALRVLGEAMMRVERTGERWWEAELYRLKGEMLVRQGFGQGKEAETRAQAQTCFASAIDIARRQGAKSFLLRAAISGYTLGPDPAENDSARQVLEQAYASFTEGFDTADLELARAMRF